MFKWYMTEKFSVKVLSTGVLMYGLLKFYCICTFCTGLPSYPLVCTGLLLLGTDIYLYVLVCNHLLSYELVS